MIKRILLFLTLVLLTVAIIGCGGNGENDPNTEGKQNAEDAAAIVNDAVITVAELDIQIENTLAMYEQQGIDVTEHGDDFLVTLQEGVLDGLISQELINQATVDYSVSEAEVEEQLTLIKADFETEEEYKEALVASGLTEEFLIVSIEENLKLDKFFLENISEVEVSDAELEALFAEYNEQSEEELDFETIKPMLKETVVAEKKEEEKGKLIEELKQQANIEILI